MIVLEPKEMTWIKGQEDDPNDLCAHGKVHFEIDGKVLVNENDGEWTISASALYLLRTLESDYMKDEPLFEHVFPCCGFNMYDIEDKEDVIISGCPSGINFEIIHDENKIKIMFDSFEPFVISQENWREAVVRFSESVMNFYLESSPKTPYSEMEKKGFDKFMSEWKRRHEAAISI